MPTWCTRIKQPTRLLPLKTIKKEKACVRNFKLIFICLVYKSSKYIQQNWSRTNCFTNEKASKWINKKLYEYTKRPRMEMVWMVWVCEQCHTFPPSRSNGIYSVGYFRESASEVGSTVDTWQKEFPTMSIYMIEIDTELSTPLLRTPNRRL